VTTIGAALAEAVSGAGLARLDAEVLLRHAAGLERVRIIAHPERTLDAETVARYRSLVARRAAGEPVAYLTGQREFYGRRFEVTPAVLIPRPETELLVDAALERLPPLSPVRVLDLATGSGCVAISIALERPRAAVVAADVSPAALAVARINCAALGAGNVAPVASDWYGALAGQRYALITANPPYVAAGDPHLEALRHEPERALVAGPAGDECLAVIVRGAAAHLHAGGWLLVEHGATQAACVRERFAAAGFADIASRRDLAGHERVTGGRWPDARRVPIEVAPGGPG
jgi:release factor glutamine methyltransferase